jgi:hypothetical protein
MRWRLFVRLLVTLGDDMTVPRTPHAQKRSWCARSRTMSLAPKGSKEIPGFDDHGLDREYVCLMRLLSLLLRSFVAGQ